MQSLVICLRLRKDTRFSYEKQHLAHMETLVKPYFALGEETFFFFFMNLSVYIGLLAVDLSIFPCFAKSFVLRLGLKL